MVIQVKYIAQHWQRGTLNAIKFNRSSMSLDTAFAEWSYCLRVDKFD